MMMFVSVSIYYIYIYVLHTYPAQAMQPWRYLDSTDLSHKQWPVEFGDSMDISKVWCLKKGNISFFCNFSG